MIPSATETQRRALGDFLRVHRARLTPSMVGLLDASRRRTPGLRREEVAQLCGMSATWYTWIEQGREVSVSPAALARVARTLRLSPAERAYLFELAGKRDPGAPHGDDAIDIPAALIASLNAITIPAYLLDRLWTARAWNAPADDLFPGWLGEPGDRNLLRYVFLNPSARRFIADWEERARRVLAEFRADYGHHLDDPGAHALIAELRSQSTDFARCWDEQSVVAREGGSRTFHHPRRGFLRYEQITFTLASRTELKMVMLTPHHDEAPPPAG